MDSREKKCIIVMAGAKASVESLLCERYERSGESFGILAGYYGSSDGPNLFRDDDDFKMGMNLVAILACVLQVDILAFILMSNHVHFVLSCSESQAYAFIDEFKRRYARYVNRKYRTVELLRRNGRDVRRIDGNQESLEWAIAYVYMNCVAANICLSPTDYPWGTGGVFFKGKNRKVIDSVSSP